MALGESPRQGAMRFKACSGRRNRRIRGKSRAEAQVRNRWGALGIPDSGIGSRDEGPDLPQAVFYRRDLMGQVAGHDELVRDDASSCISSAQRIGKAQRDLPASSAPHHRLFPEICERAFVVQERVAQPSVEQEPEPPRAPPSGPDEPFRSVRTHAYLRLLRSNPSATPWSRSNLNCVSVAVR